MSDFTVKSDNVDVEQIMRQVRSRIREKRGVDYSEDEIRELASVKLERFLDPKGVRSDLLEQYRKRREASTAPRNYAFEDTTLFESSRPLLRALRKLLNPILKLFFNPTPMVEALHIQSRLNDSYNQAEALYYELIHNLVLETTRLGIEVKNLKMRVESMSSRLDFDERRARALEGVVQYRPGAVAPLPPPAGDERGERERRDHRDRGRDREGDRDRQPDRERQPGNLGAVDPERRNRRRRRRGRRRPGGPGFGERPGNGEAPSNEGSAPDSGLAQAGSGGEPSVARAPEPPAPSRVEEASAPPRPGDAGSSSADS
jgi:hypothetical protein